MFSSLYPSNLNKSKSSAFIICRQYVLNYQGLPSGLLKDFNFSIRLLIIYLLLISYY